MALLQRLREVGYFADPDGHVWEAVRAPGFSFTADGRVTLPD